MAETRTDFVNRIMGLSLGGIQGMYSYCNDQTRRVLFSLNQVHGEDSHLILSPSWAHNGFKHSLKHIGKILDHGYDLYVFKTMTKKNAKGQTVSAEFEPKIEKRQLYFDGKCYFALPINMTLIQQNDEFEKAVVRSTKDDVTARRERLKIASSIPETRVVTTTVFVRNPDVVAEVLYQANGCCQRCKKPAPFQRSSDGTPYLEVHHKLPLALDGKDNVENAIALCPNCHREMHFGM
jgi:5-methylcytosine-specific restriction protein A